MVKQVVRLIGALYGIIGLASLPGFFLFLTYGPKANELSTGDLIQYLLFILGIPLLNIIICFTVLYSFWKFRKWGRYLAIIYNSLWLTAFILGPIVSRLTETNPPELTRPAVLFFLIIIIFFGSLTVACLRHEVKQLMRN